MSEENVEIARQANAALNKRDGARCQPELVA